MIKPLSAWTEMALPLSASLPSLLQIWRWASRAGNTAIALAVMPWSLPGKTVSYRDLFTEVETAALHEDVLLRDQGNDKDVIRNLEAQRHLPPDLWQNRIFNRKLHFGTRGI